MHKYHFVAKGVEPKREALRFAQEELAETQRILDAAKQRLAAVENGLLAMQAKYNECVRKKQELETKTKECEARLVRADKVRSSLVLVYLFILKNVQNKLKYNLKVTRLEIEGLPKLNLSDS